MKKIVLTFIISFLTFIANAQEAKPTKEQTLQYLKNFYSSILSPSMEETTLEYSSTLISSKSCSNFNRTKNICTEFKTQNIIPK